MIVFICMEGRNTREQYLIDLGWKVLKDGLNKESISQLCNTVGIQKNETLDNLILNQNKDLYKLNLDRNCTIRA